MQCFHKDIGGSRNFRKGIPVANPMCRFKLLVICPLLVRTDGTEHCTAVSMLSCA